MIKAFVVLIMFIAISSTALITNYMVSYQQSQNQLIEQDKDILQDIKNTLVTNTIYYNGAKLLPYGENGVNHHELPYWLVSQKKNPFGVPYIYCPYSEKSLSTANKQVNLNSTDSYNVSTIKNLATNSKDYVEESDASPFSGVLALVISPHKKDHNITCETITTSNGYFVAPKALVVGIYEDSLLYNDLKKRDFKNLSQTDNTIYGLQSELKLWQSYQPYQVTYNLKTGDTFELKSGLSYVSEKPEKIILTIQGAEKLLGSKLTTDVSNGNITFENVNIIIRNIEVINDLNITFKNSKVLLKDSTLSSTTFIDSDVIIDNSDYNPTTSSTNNLIYANNSNVLIKNDNTFSNISSNSLLRFENSSLSIEKNTTQNISVIDNNEILQLVNSEAYIDNNNLFVSTTNSSQPLTLITVDFNSLLNLSNTSITMPVSTSAIYIGGKANIDNTTIVPSVGSSYGLVLNEGGTLNLNNSQIGQSGGNVNIGISDQGGYYMSGGSNNIYANTCTSGDLFNKKISKTIDDNTVDSADPNTGVVNPITVENTFDIDINDYFNKLNVSCL